MRTFTVGDVTTHVQSDAPVELGFKHKGYIGLAKGCLILTILHQDYTKNDLRSSKIAEGDAPIPP